MSADPRSTAPPVPDPDSARTTTRVLRLLRAHRRAALRGNRGDAAYLAYLVVFVGGLAIPPVGIAMIEVIAEPPPLDPWPAHRFAALAPLFLAGCLALLWASAREATVRGPIQVSAPLIDWVLPLPVDRSRFLAPTLLRSAALRAATGAVLGPLALVFLWRTVLPMPDPGDGAGAVLAGGGAAWALLAQAGLAGALVGIASTACGALIVAFGTRATRLLRPWHALAQLLLVGTAVLIWALPLPAPWLRVGSWVGLALLVLGAVWLFALAWRSLDLVEPSSLRERAATGLGLRSGIWMSDPSWYQVAVTERMDRSDQDTAPVRPPAAAPNPGRPVSGGPEPGAEEAHGPRPGGQAARFDRQKARPGGPDTDSAGSGHKPGGQATRFGAENTPTTKFRSWLRTWCPTGFRSRPASGPRLRLQPPRGARYLVLWRDLLGMLRAPYPVLRGCLLGWVALALVRVDAHLEGAAAVGWVLAPAVLLYLAATQLLSGARMDVADPRRVRYLPPTQSFGTLALMHGVLPLACLFAAVGVALPFLVLNGASPADAGSLLLVLPAVVAGALVGVYRGWMPDHLTVGVETPMGNTAPLQMAAWHLSGLLGLLVATAPVTVGVGLGWGPGVVLGLWWLDVLWVLLGTAWLVSWARRRARASLSA